MMPITDRRKIVFRILTDAKNDNVPVATQCNRIASLAKINNISVEGKTIRVLLEEIIEQPIDNINKELP